MKIDEKVKTDDEDWWFFGELWSVRKEKAVANMKMDEEMCDRSWRWMIILFLFWEKFRR